MGARGKLRLLLSLAMAMVDMAMDATAMVDTEDMAMADMVTTAIMARGLLMLMPTTATEDMAMATATVRDLQMPTTATEDMEDMVMDTAMATVMDTATMDKKEGIAMMSR